MPILAILASCGGDQVGASATRFNAEQAKSARMRADAAKTLLVKPPKAPNGGMGESPVPLGAKPRLMNDGPASDRTEPTSRSPEAPTDARTGVAATAVPIVPTADQRRRIAEAEKRRLATQALQAETDRATARRRVETLRAADARTQAARTRRPAGRSDTSGTR